jgi:hypothetical protein|tara:strand:+ start:165 stop:665 length:501 start_codon:yes stop_codon:yes gene_type:complete
MTTITGNFELSNEMKSRQGNRKFVFGEHQWGRLTNWIAAETLYTPSFDMDGLFDKMYHVDIEIRQEAKREFNRRISRAIIMGDGDRQFMCGETSTNFPKIKSKTYRTIKISDLVWIINDHRAKLKEWSKPKPVKPVKPVQKPELPEPELVIENDDVPDDWDTIDEN